MKSMNSLNYMELNLKLDRLNPIFFTSPTINILFIKLNQLKGYTFQKVKC